MNNEEKILAMLEKHDAMFEKQAALLDKLTSDMTEMKTDMAELKTDMAELKTTQAAQGKQLAEHGKQLAEIKATQATQQSQLDKLVEMQNELRTAVNRVAMAQEQDMLPYIKLLDEGHHNIMRQLVAKERVEVLEKDMRIVKGAVKKHTQQIAALEKAN